VEIDAGKLKAISDARLAAIEAAISGFDAGVQRVATGLRMKLIDLLASGTAGPRTAAVRELVYLQQQLQAQLNALGYDAEVVRFLDLFDLQQEFAIGTARALGVPASRLSILHSGALEALRASNYEYLASLGPSAVRTMAIGVVQNTLAGVSRSRIIDSMRGVLAGRFVSYASTYADTALVSYDRRVSMDIWQEAGLEKFLYRGPRDIKNRVFCEKHVGKIYTLAEIKKLDNGMKPPMNNVLLYGGGWNCRHVWTPDLPEGKMVKKPTRRAIEAFTATTLDRRGASQRITDWISKLLREQ